MRFVPARLSAYYVAHFACTGVHLPFWSVWLASRGVAPEQIGVLLALGHWVSIVTAPLAGRVADGSGRGRVVMGVLAMVAALGFVAFTQARELFALGALALVTFGAHAALLPLAESVTQERALAGEAFYGRVRLWGSIAFVAASAAVGALVERTSIDVVPWALAAGGLACVVASQALPPRRTSAVIALVGKSPETPREPSRAIAWGPLALGIVLASAIQATHAVYYGFASLAWRAHGLGESAIGALWSAGVFAEVLLFALSPAIVARTGPAALLVIGALGGAVRWGVLAHAGGAIAPIALAQALHALSFGATHLGGMELVRRAVPSQRLASAQGIYSAVSGVAYGLATPIAGALYARHHDGAYLVVAVVAAVLSVTAAAAAPRLVRAAEPRPTSA